MKTYKAKLEANYDRGRSTVVVIIEAESVGRAVELANIEGRRLDDRGNYEVADISVFED